MKNLIFKNKYTKGISAGILIILSPVIMMLLLSVPSLFYPDDCDIAAVCEHTIVQISQSLGFGVFIFGLPTMLLGGFITLLSLFLYGIHTFRNRDVSSDNFKLTKIILGSLAGIVILYALYIPAGSDECSRTITAGQYTNCLEQQLLGMTEAAARIWLEERGYENTWNYERKSWGTFGRENYQDLDVENYFEATRRSFDRPNSLPYGTNFARWVLPMFPAPASFSIGIGIDQNSVGVYYIHPDWSFSFL